MQSYVFFEKEKNYLLFDYLKWIVNPSIQDIRITNPNGRRPFFQHSIRNPVNPLSIISLSDG